MAAKKTKDKKRERRERRFLPRSTHSLLLVQVMGALGAAALGAGAWAQFIRPMTVTPNAEPLAPLVYAWWILAAGALVLGLAVWLGTSGEAALRVGDAGIAIEKGGLRRVAWYDLASIGWDGAASALIVGGKDESGNELSTRVRLESQPQALAWIVKEARVRASSVVDLSDDVLEQIPEALTAAGEIVMLDPIQVVGKRCAESDKIIAYEPDARVCARCERVYHKTKVPERCACGASLAALRAKPVAELTSAGERSE